ncbi:MAG: ATP-binding cassette domain-containing protein [Marinospirillum sp.]|uniref:ABC transporter ATP-binding protein n=1 Tax=Marinospirillum sp. TaxID=2183934 RepID=UPI001A0C8D2F|nr:ABC transporter ATP-binding protein [Marinospirillum sp.]MBE0505634.1 ATP-binding cassette domain-containing protein [Marinospirillum sp.]
MSIAIKGLSFNYGARQALKDLNFTLPDGSFTALLGPNGAGKTTLLSLLTRLLSLQQGEVSINRVDLKRQPRLLMQQLGVVFQQSTLDLDLTVLQNLQYHAALHGIPPKEARHRAETEMARWQLSERLHDRVRQLNGGHRRRVEIARALLHRPSVLLLDEATSGLDTRARIDLNRHVRHLCHEQQLTVLWTTHLIEEISTEDQVLILHHGSLLANASAKEICKQSGTFELGSAFEKITGLQQETT